MKLSRRIFFCLPLLAALQAAGQPRAVDTHLVLAVDSSSSMDMNAYYLQLEGYARAFTHPDLWDAIRSGPHRAIAVALFEWAGPRQQVVNVEWRILDSVATLNEFAGELVVAPRFVISGTTALGDALHFGTRLFDSAPGNAARRVMDISGDGRANRGASVTRARDAALARDIVINGLAVVGDDPDLESYFRDEVIGGAGSFVITARDYNDFADVILRKLIREIRHIAAAR
jgi:hypothetical protein